MPDIGRCITRGFIRGRTGISPRLNGGGGGSRFGTRFCADIVGRSTFSLEDGVLLVLCFVVHVSPNEYLSCRFDACGARALLLLDREFG